MLNQSEMLLVPKIKEIIEEGYQMNTSFLLTHVPDPKTNKRIKVFKSYGNTSVICSRRKSQDIWEPVYSDVKHYIYDFDLPASQHIIKRYFVSKQYQKAALKRLNKLQPDVIYADGMDSLLIAAKYKRKHRLKLFYDVADLRESYIEESDNLIKSAVNFIIKKIEKRCFQNVDYLVVTSEKFYEVYYHRLIRHDRVIYIPNAPDPEVFKGYQKKSKGDFTVGFIGGIRYLAQMKMLVDAAGKCGCNVIFAGAGGTSEDYRGISEYCKNNPFVRFTGKYDYQKDIARLYGMVDCVYAVYNADNPNVRIALPNKLYESVLCELPIIVAKGTYLSELVEKWGVGVSVSHTDAEELAAALRRLKEDTVLRGDIVQHCKEIKDSVCIERFHERIEKIFGSDHA